MLAALPAGYTPSRGSYYYPPRQPLKDLLLAMQLVTYGYCYLLFLVALPPSP
jgi:hypothetical protein